MGLRLAGGSSAAPRFGKVWTQSGGVQLYRKRRSPPAAMPIISRGLPSYESGNFYLPSYIFDSDYSTIWRSITPPSTTPQRWALDLSGVANASKSSVVLVWYNDPPTGDYYQTDVQTSNVYQAQPRDYTIQKSSAAGGGSPPAIGDASWSTIQTVTGNTKHSQQFALNLSGANWVQMRFSAANGLVGTNDDVAMQCDIHNVAAGNQDNYLMLGDSITAQGMLRRNASGSAWLNGPLATLINTARPSQYPLIENGGVSFQTAAWAVTNFSTLTSGFTGKYIGLSYGTNDASAPTADTTYYTNMLSLVDSVIALGKVPIIPLLPQRQDSAGGPDVYIQAYNVKIRQIYTDRPTVIKGPDLYTPVANGTIPLADGVHPTTTGPQPNGFELYLNYWRDALLAAIY